MRRMRRVRCRQDEEHVEDVGKQFSCVLHSVQQIHEHGSGQAVANSRHGVMCGRVFLCWSPFGGPMVVHELFPVSFYMSLNPMSMQMLYRFWFSRCPCSLPFWLSRTGEQGLDFPLYCIHLAP
jgi:hypothetical protein